MDNTYIECVCRVNDTGRRNPTIYFREAKCLWFGGGFCGGGKGYSHFGVTMKKNETKTHVVNRLLNKKIKEINESISRLERDREMYTKLMISFTEDEKRGCAEAYGK